MVFSVTSTALWPSSAQCRQHRHFRHHQASRCVRGGFHDVFRGVASSITHWAVTFTLLLSSVMLTSNSPFGDAQGGAAVAALSCDVCDLHLCSNTTTCPGGTVPDVCGCCQVCAHMENQTCGGPFGIFGRCDRNLHCFIRKIPGRRITGNEEGICKEIKIRCEEPNCPLAYKDVLCPPDSYLATHTASRDPPNALHNTIDANIENSPDMGNQLVANTSNISYNPNDKNNDNNSEKKSDAAGQMVDSYFGQEQTSYCMCNTSLCETPVCATGYSLHLTHNATGEPGSCCDEFQCTTLNECLSVTCPPYQESLCPEDSILLPPTWTENGCCELQQGCTCPSVDECKPVVCPVGFQIQVISRASRLPGSCCDRFQCVNESGLTCTYNGQEMSNGQTWSIDKCKTCECRDGLNRCKDKSCQNLSCTWMVIPDGECCPVCRGCVSDSGELYNTSAVWKENDCTTCRCRDGHAQCQSEMCATHCAHPVYVPGQCCPVCSGGEPDSAVVSLCPSIDNCRLSCTRGYAQSADGCSLCQCKREPCDLDCQFGLMTDIEGHTVCRCRGPETRCPEAHEVQCDKKCEYGYKRSRDGCIKCKCNKCPPFNCTKHCLHGHILNDEGCPLCKCKVMHVPELISSNQEPESVEGKDCMSPEGSRHVNGESWNDGCRVCYCHKGVEMCSLIACPAPQCLNPTFRTGDCCPTCPGLTIISPNGEKELCQSSMGKYYVEGETWKMDGCTHCVCHGGVILCETPACPPLLCHHPIKHKDQCCAICRGDGMGLVPTASYNHHCTEATGMMYKHGEVWKATPCQSCVCRNGQIHCYNQMCPLVNCNKTVLRKGQCCPTCVDSGRPNTCVVKGVTYDSGEKWQGENCTQCLCSEGKRECFPLTCPSLGCSVLVRPKGHCCPECYDLSKLHKEFINSGHWNTDNTTEANHNKSQTDGNIVGYAILSVLLFVLAIVIVVLVLCLMKRRQKTKFRMRPKSTNLELQGQMPFIPDSNPKTVNMEKQYLKKLCPGIASEKGKGDRTSNPYMEIIFGGQKK